MENTIPTNPNEISEKRCIILAENGYYPHILIKHDSELVISAIARGLRTRSFDKNLRSQGDEFYFDVATYSTIPDEDLQINEMISYLTEPATATKIRKLQILLDKPLLPHQSHLFIANSNRFSSISEPSLIVKLINNACVTCDEYFLMDDKQIIITMIRKNHIHARYYEIAKNDDEIRIEIAKQDSLADFSSDPNPTIRKESLLCTRNCYLFENDDSLQVLSALIEVAAEEGHLDIINNLAEHYILKAPECFSSAEELERAYKFQLLLLIQLDVKLFTNSAFDVLAKSLLKSKYKDIKAQAKMAQITATFKSNQSHS